MSKHNDTQHVNKVVVIFSWSFYLVVAGSVSAVNPILMRSQESPADHGYGILGANYSDIKESPYTVSLYSDEYGMIIGSGAILNHNWLLISAYEVFVLSESYITIRAGSNDSQCGGQVTGVADIQCYSDGTKQFVGDIALVRTTSTLQYNDSVRPIKFSNVVTPKTGSKGIITAYGRNEKGSGFLQAAEMTVVDFDACNKTYGGILPEYVFCADSDTYTPAFSDLGAPFVQNNKLLGNYIGANVDCPKVFNVISYWKDWIKSTMKKYSRR